MNTHINNAMLLCGLPVLSRIKLKYIEKSNLTPPGIFSCRLIFLFKQYVLILPVYSLILKSFLKFLFSPCLTWMLWEEHLASPKLPHYHNMQNSWSMDFISWFFTHVSQLKFILFITSRNGKGGWEAIMRRGCPKPQMKHLVAQMQPDRAASGVSCQGGSTVLWYCRRWQTLIIFSLTQRRRREERAGSNGLKESDLKKKKKTNHPATSWAGSYSLHGIFIINC